MKDEFKKLYFDWINSFGVSAHGCCNPAAKEPYENLKEWCKNHKEEGVQYIKEILEEGPNDIVMILPDLYGNDYFEVEGFMPLDQYCNVWLNILNCSIKDGQLIDYYKEYNEWKEYLDKNYIPWNPFTSNIGDPNVTFKEYKEGKRNSNKI